MFLVAVSVMSLLGAGVIAVLFRYVVRWTFVVPVCFFEGQTFFQALRRSARLVRGSFWRIVGIILAWAMGSLLVMGVIMTVLGTPAGLPAAGRRVCCSWRWSASAWWPPPDLSVCSLCP